MSMNRAKYLFVLIPALMYAACRNSATPENDLHDEKENFGTLTEDTIRHANDSVKTEVKTFRSDNGWGYDIFIDSKLYIHQPNIPSVSGTNGFANEESAKRCGEFIAFKIRNHILPPSVSPVELDSLNGINRDQ